MQIQIQPDEVEKITAALRFRAGDMVTGPLYRYEWPHAKGLLLLANQIEEQAQVAARSDQNDEDG